MIEVFKTDLQHLEETGEIAKTLSLLLPRHKINFDLDDCDKILRVEGEFFDHRTITELLQKHNYLCIRLE